jgi:hypothetical protein
MSAGFLRSPADEMGITARDRLRAKRTRGKLLNEHRDQDVGVAEGRVGPQRETSNPLFNKTIQEGSHRVSPQDTEGTAGSQWSGDQTGGPAPMTDAEVQSALHKFVWDAIEYTDQELSPFRALVTKYYKGEPFGNEEEGRSQFISTDLRDTVLMMMPSMMRIFFGAERALEYGPRNMKQVEAAQQMTDYIWDIVVSSDNAGFLSFYEWFKDALTKRLGIMKFWYDDSSETKAFTGHFWTAEQVAQIKQDESISIENISISPGSNPALQLYDIEYSQHKADGRIRFIAMPPEEYIFTRGSRTTQARHYVPGVALFVGHRTEVTRSQLAEMGIDEETIEEWAFKDSSLDHNQEEIARQEIVKPDTSAIGPIATQKALYIEGYPYMDVDGDGIAELRKIVMLGPSYHVISNEPCDRRPFATLCPDPEPHTIIGQCVADWVMDLQKLNSSVWRSMLDSLALSINPRIGFVEGAVSLEDVMNTELAAPIRMSMPNALQPIEHNFVGREALAVLEKIEEVKQNRSGVKNGSAELNGDALQSTTQVAAAAQVASAQAHIELIARVFAETGVKEFFQGLLELLVENPPRQRIIRSQGTYVEMSPDSWDVDLDVCVKVAIGAGMDGEKYQALADAREEMKFIMTTWGLQNPICGMKTLRDTNVKMLKLRGRMDAEMFFNDVPANWQPPPPPVQDPNMVIAQAEQMKAETQQKASEAKVQLEAQKHEMVAQQKIHELELKIQQMQVDQQLEQAKMALNAQTQIQVAQINAGIQENQAQFMAEIKRLEVLLGHAADIHKNETAAQAQVDSAQASGDAGGE